MSGKKEWASATGAAQEAQGQNICGMISRSKLLSCSTDFQQLCMMVFLIIHACLPCLALSYVCRHALYCVRAFLRAVFESCVCTNLTWCNSNVHTVISGTWPLAGLSGEAVKDRHWKQISQKLKITIGFNEVLASNLRSLAFLCSCKLGLAEVVVWGAAKRVLAWREFCAYEGDEVMQ